MHARTRKAGEDLSGGIIEVRDRPIPVVLTILLQQAGADGLRLITEPMKGAAVPASGHAPADHSA